MKMMREMKKTAGRKINERGVALVELAIGATVFFTVIFAVLEFSRLLWTHNALADAARLGARYAAINLPNSTTSIKKVVVFGVANPADGALPVVNGLTINHVTVSHSGNFGVKQGTVSVSITGYVFNFSVPIVGATVTLPDYKTTLTGESAGYEPNPL
jgi:Flp pilus assembly protein TadG